LTSDLVVLQELLGEKGLSLNDSKTALGQVDHVDLPRQIDTMKRDLLQIRRLTIEISGEETEVDSVDVLSLTPQQLEYLLDLLESPDMDESDAELVLVLLRDHAKEVLPKMLDLLAKYPGLTKSLHHYVRLAQDRSGLDAVLLSFLRGSPNATEYQLFWLAKVAEDFLPTSPILGEILMAAADHSRATIVSRAKVLEMPDRRFGLPELREEVLRSGRSDWEAWAAAAGTRSQPAASRNHLLTYFAKGSPINALIAQCIQALP
jgi:hypothetical protein